MSPNEYERANSELLLEQYKLYVEMADRISQRREQSNRFYVGLLTALVALLVVLTRLNPSNGIEAIVFLIDGLCGVLLSVIWFINIQSYRALNKVKFEIINNLEIQLPAQGYTKEWEMLDHSGGCLKYFQLTVVEQFVPAVVFTLFSGLVIYSIVLLLVSC